MIILKDLDDFTLSPRALAFDFSNKILYLDRNNYSHFLNENLIVFPKVT